MSGLVYDIMQAFTLRIWPEHGTKGDEEE